MSWAQLTNPGLAYPPDDSSFYGTDAPSGTKAGGSVKYFKSKAARAKAFADAAALTAQPSPETVTGQFATPSDVQQTGVTLPDAAPSGVGPLAPSQAQPGPDFGPGPQQPDPTQSSFTSPAISPAAPKFLQPSFAQTLTDANGMPTGPNPAQTKLGKLASLILSLGKGAMAGRAANEQMLAASGGHRSGGLGVGFEAAERQPYEEASMAQGEERGALQNQTERSQLAMMPWQWQQRGQLNAADIALKQAETERAKAQTGYWGSYAGQRDQLDLQHLHAQAVEQAITAGRDPNIDPKVQGYQDAITSIQRPPATPRSPAETPFLAWRDQNPNAPIGQFFDTEAKAKAKYDKTSNRPTSEEFKYNLYQRDPQAFSAIYGAARDEVQARNNMLRYRNELADQLKSGFPEEADAANMQQTIRDLDTQLQGAFQKPEKPVLPAVKSAITAVPRPGLPAELQTSLGEPTAPAPPVTGAVPTAKAGPSTAPPDKSQATRALRNKQGNIAYLIGNRWYVDSAQGLTATK